MKIKVVYKSKHQLPSFSTSLAAGVDLRTNVDEKIVIKLGQRVLVNTELYVEIPV